MIAYYSNKFLFYPQYDQMKLFWHKPLRILPILPRDLQCIIVAFFLTENAETRYNIYYWKQ